MHTPDAPLNVVTDGIERVGSKLLALFDALAPRLLGKTEAEIEALLMDAVREALEELPPDDGPIAA